jgi:O-antigen/teichoic acid export membrane protein
MRETGIRKRQILLNSIMSVVQVVVSGGTLFVLYRFLLNTIGIEQLGTWSIVLSTTSIANIANLGLSASVVKYVAKYLARDEKKNVADVIQTSAISICIFIGLVSLIAYPAAKWLLGLIVPSAGLKEALSILPYALASCWISMVAGVFLAGLDGCQRIDIRSRILIASSLIYLPSCFVLVPIYGLIGLAYCQFGQAIIVLIGSWVMLRRYLSMLPMVPYKWNRKVFSEMVGYGFSFQIISITQFVCDPVTKALLSKYGGLSIVGFYEMASRMIHQLRMLLVSANQVLVPSIADLHERKPASIQALYKENYRLIYFLSLPSYAIIIALAPMISEIWIGYYEATFVIISCLIAINLFINTLSVPAYLSYLGIGKLKWNTVGHITTAFMNVALGLIMGYILGGIWIVIAWIISSITGSVLIAVSYHCTYKIPLSEFFPKESTTIAIACVIANIITLVAYYCIHRNYIASTIISISILAIIIIIPFWGHPMRKRLMRSFSDLLLNGQRQ